jgi:beta-lactamase class A
MRKLFILLAIILIIAAALLTPSYLRYRRTAGAVPPEVRLAGLDLYGADAAEVKMALEELFTEPVAAYYAGQRVILRPQMVEFQVDVEAMLAQAEGYNTPAHLLRVLVGQLLDRPPAPADVPLRYTLNGDALDNWLVDVARHYDRPPLPPQPVLATLSIAPGQPGQQLDIPASHARLIAALTNPHARTADLVVHETAAPPIDMAALAELLRAGLNQFPGIASVFLHHTSTGEEVAINADVAFAGMSTMKIAILEEVYRKLDAPPDAETIKLITQTTSLSGNFTANLLLGIVGDGDPNAGVRVLNESLRTLGLKNSFMATPYDRKLASPPRIVTAANSRTDFNTQPDPYVQTTPRDIGLMLEMIVECSEGGGTLLAAYGDQPPGGDLRPPGGDLRLTPAECQQALDYLALNEMRELIVAGVPADTRAIHKHGYVADTHGDVAAIWGPAGPYVLSIFLYRPPWLEWAISSATMKDLSTAVWNYFLTVDPSTSK